MTNPSTNENDPVCPECGNDICSEGLPHCWDCMEALEREPMDAVDWEQTAKDAIAALNAKMQKHKELLDTHIRNEDELLRMRERMRHLVAIVEETTYYMAAIDDKEYDRADSIRCDLDTMYIAALKAGAVPRYALARIGGVTE